MSCCWSMLLPCCWCHRWWIYASWCHCIVIFLAMWHCCSVCLLLCCCRQCILLSCCKCLLVVASQSRKWPSQSRVWQMHRRCPHPTDDIQVITQWAHSNTTGNNRIVVFVVIVVAFELRHCHCVANACFRVVNAMLHLFFIDSIAMSDILSILQHWYQ